MSPTPTVSIEQVFALALQHHQAGRLSDAEALYRQVLAAQPRHAGALHFLGVIAQQVGRHDLAVELIRQATVLEPNHHAAHSNLGEAYRSLGRLDEAIASLHRALQLKPDHAEAYNNLGSALQQSGDLESAVAAYRRALDLKPNMPEAGHNLAMALALQSQRDATATVPSRAAQPESGDPETDFNLGTTLIMQGQLEEAVAALSRAVQLKPDYGEAYNNLGVALAKLDQTDKPVAAFRRALELNPNNADAWNNLGNLLKNQGQLDEAIAAYRRTLLLNPGQVATHSNLIYTLHFHPDHDDRTIAEEHQRWNRQFGDPLKPSLQRHTNERSPGRRLRVGYVSPDFRFQAEAFFVLPLLEAHDHSQFEIHCYSSVTVPDYLTDRFRRSANVWHDVQGLSDHDLAQQIRADRTDILVDLTMHMAHNRVLVFARQPAPVQIAWLAYPGSTGLETMDYRLTDHYMDPPAIEAPYSSEASLHLADCWCCYHPLTDEPAVNRLPASDTAGITFGCFNNFCKINEPTVALFASALRAVEGSRLLLMTPEGNARERVLDQFGQHGILRKRIECVGPTPRPEYLKLCHRVDIALDPLPYNGITTTCDALWMGVPVISLAGKTAAGRAGLSLLSTVGLPEFATHSSEDFVRVAKQWTDDRRGLAKLREELRPRMEASPLMDAPRFARNVEAAYQKAWRTWCAERQS